MKLNFETQILTSEKNIENLCKLNSFLKGMIKAKPDGFLEYYEKELSQNIYYIRQLQKFIDDNKIEIR